MCVGQNLGQFMFAQFGLHVCLEGNCVCCRSVSCYRIDLTGSSVCVCLTGFSGAEPPGGQQPPTQGVWEAARPPPGGPQEAPRKHPGGPQEAPRRPTGRPQEATRKPPGGPPGPQEAPWRSPGDPRKATKLIVNANTSSAQIIISAASILNCYCL